MGRPPSDAQISRVMAELGRRGGERSTKAKIAASRANGAKGGAPRLRPRCPRCEAANRTCYHLKGD